MSQSKPEKNTDATLPRSPAEWISFTIASIILAVILGLVGYLWASKREQKPPEVKVSGGEMVREAAGQFYVPFEVTNTGGETAESVQVKAELSINGAVAESGEVEVDFLSSRETESGAFVFSQNPRRGKLVLRVASYKSP